MKYLLTFLSFWVHFLKVLNIELWICCVPDWNGEDWIMKPPTLLSCWRNNFGIPDFLFSNSKRKSIKYEKKSCFFWETVIKVLFFCGWMVLKKKKLMTFKWRWKIASFYFWITLQDCLDKEYNFHMICIIINLILSARRGMKPTSASTFLLLTCWWRLRIPLLRIMNGANAALLSVFFRNWIEKHFTYSILLFFLNVPYYVLYPKIIVNNWGGTSALLNCTLNARKIQTKCSIERFPLKEKWNNEWNIQKKFNSKFNLGTL